MKFAGEIRPLAALEPAALRRLNAGYVSTERYAASKQETAEAIVFSLRLEPCAPFVKRWETPEEDIARYQLLPSQGFCYGAFAGNETGPNELVAIALAEPQWWNRSLQIWEFHVAPEYQRQGIGSLLMDTLAARAQEAGLRVMVCETQNTNAPAIRFYRAAGFAIDALDLSFYTNHDMSAGDVAIFMKRKL